MPHSIAPQPAELSEHDRSFEVMVGNVVAHVEVGEVATFQDKTAWGRDDDSTSGGIGGSRPNNFVATRSTSGAEFSITEAPFLASDKQWFDLIPMASWPVDLGRERPLAAVHQMAALFGVTVPTRPGARNFDFGKVGDTLFAIGHKLPDPDGRTILQIAGAVSDEQRQGRSPTPTLCTLVLSPPQPGSLDPVQDFVSLLKTYPDDALIHVMSRVSGDQGTYAPLAARRERDGGRDVIQRLYTAELKEGRLIDRTMQERVPSSPDQWVSTPLD